MRPSFIPALANARARSVALLAALPFLAAVLPPASGAHPLSAQDAGPATDGAPLRIGLIGAGAMGGPLGLLWAEAGHEVVFSSRNPGELMDLVAEAAPRASAAFSDGAAHFGEVVVLAVPSGAIPQLAEDLGDLLDGKIVVDITNPRADRDGPIADEWLEMGTGTATAQYFPGARVVKAFNTLGAFMIGQDRPADARIAVPLAGDDEEAVRIVAGLVRDAGFDPVIVGSLERAEEFDRGTPVWVTGMTAEEVRRELGLPPEE